MVIIILQTLANAEIKEVSLTVSLPEVAKMRQNAENKSYHEEVSCEWSHHRDLVCYIRHFLHDSLRE